MAKLSIEDIGGELKGKKVLMRVDFNVPLDENRNITSEKRIKAALPSIKYVIEKGGKLILMSHMGRPKGEKKPEFSLDVAAKKLSELIGKDVKFAPDCIGPEAEKTVNSLSDGDVALLENLRFYKEETDNDPEFSKKLASLGEIYINDAFGTAHRAHASVEGVTKYMKKCAAGFLMNAELKYIGETLEKAEKPFVAILGGAKVSDKLQVIENLMSKVDTIIIGGAMCFTFAKAKGEKIGDSLCEDDFVDKAEELLEKSKDGNCEILLPVDAIAAREFKADAEHKVVEGDIEDGWLGLDIGPKSAKLFAEKISNAKTVVWNGPMGVFEMEAFAGGTKTVANALAQATKAGARTVIGGGDSASAIKQLGLEDQVSHVSTGGGASLEMMEGKKFVVLAILDEK